MHLNLELLIPLEYRLKNFVLVLATLPLGFLDLPTQAGEKSVIVK